MRKLQYIPVIGIIIMAGFLASCSKKGLITYEGTESIYFTTNYNTSLDTTLMTFAYSASTIKDSTVAIPISVMGDVTKSDRSYKIVVADSSTAKAGVHYDALQDTFKIRAGRAVDTFKIKLHRTVDLQTAPVSVILLLQPNSNFKTDMSSRITNTVTGASFSYVKYKLVLTDVLTQPKYWLSTYMGTFSRKKVYLSASVLNVPIATMLDILANNTGSAAISSQNFWGRSMQIYLNQQKAAGSPIYEDDGTTLMVMGASVQ